MTKYNQSFKQQVIEFYFQNSKNRSLTRQHFQLNETTLTYWINQYNQNSINGLAVFHNKQVYSPEFKLSVIQAVNHYPLHFSDNMHINTFINIFTGSSNTILI